VLNAEGRKILESSGLSGFGFQPVFKTRIVRLEWEKWNLSMDHPPEYPSEGEPENYILDRPHDAALASQMGDIWELVVPKTVRVGRAQKVESFKDLWVERSTWNGADIFRGDDYGGALVTQRAKDWLQEHFAGFVQFEEFPSK
jgi:hypothetical protein